MTPEGEVVVGLTQGEIEAICLDSGYDPAARGRARYKLRAALADPDFPYGDRLALQAAESTLPDIHRGLGALKRAMDRADEWMYRAEAAEARAEAYEDDYRRSKQQYLDTRDRADRLREALEGAERRFVEARTYRDQGRARAMDDARQAGEELIRAALKPCPDCGSTDPRICKYKTASGYSHTHASSWTGPRRGGMWAAHDCCPNPYHQGGEG